MNQIKKEIHERALSLAKEFKRSEANLISVLQEVEESKLFFDLGLTGLFQYAIRILELSEDVAYCFITVSRKAKQVPELFAAIQNGSVSVSKAKKAALVITAKNQSEWSEEKRTRPRTSCDCFYSCRCETSSRPTRSRKVYRPRL
jgi:hypothetical protein